MARIHRIALALPVLLTMVTASVARDTASRAQEEEAIWQLEQALYSSGTGGGNLANYVKAMDGDYAGWPPQFDAPLGYSHIADAARTSGRNRSEVAMKKDLVRVHRDGNVALVFYTSHRTMRGGAAADDSFETLHVWVKDANDTWKLFGAMVRDTPATRGHTASHGAAK